MMFCDVKQTLCGRQQRLNVEFREADDAESRGRNAGLVSA